MSLEEYDRHLRGRGIPETDTVRQLALIRDFERFLGSATGPEALPAGHLFDPDLDRQAFRGVFEGDAFRIGLKAVVEGVQRLPAFSDILKNPRRPAADDAVVVRAAGCALRVANHLAGLAPDRETNPRIGL